MGQHCSCMEHTPKHQRHQSDDIVTADMERVDDEDGDQELDVLVSHNHTLEIHELLGTRKSTNSGCRNSQRRFLNRTGFSVDFGLLTAADKREENGVNETETEEQHMQRYLSTGLIGLDADYRLTPSLSPDALSSLLRSYQEATGVVDNGRMDLECIMCLDTFSQDNPKVRTLCNCGMNRTNFHMSCLLEWLNRDANCPVCREYLFFED